MGSDPAGCWQREADGARRWLDQVRAALDRADLVEAMRGDEVVRDHLELLRILGLDEVEALVILQDLENRRRRYSLECQAAVRQLQDADPEHPLARRLGETRLRAVERAVFRAEERAARKGATD